MISTIRGQLLDVAPQNVIYSYQMDLLFQTNLQIQIKELWFDDTYLSKVRDDIKSLFTRMEVLDPI